MIYLLVKTKEENSNFCSENSCNQSLDSDQSNVNTIELVNVKVEPEDDFNMEERSFNNIIHPITTKDGK